MTAQDTLAGGLGGLTDLYQLTMADGFFQAGLAEREAAFHLTFRRPPFGGGFAVAAGLEQALQFLERWRFDAEDLAFLRGLTGRGGRALLSEAFLQQLEGARFEGDVHAVAEGTVVGARVPLLRVTAPLWQAQVVETALLTAVNFQTLIATKAARVVRAAQGRGVLEFGLRRAQGFDGGLSASRAAYLGGCVATSNVLAGRAFGIPVRGTHAHSWVMAFGDEREAFDRYVDAMPHNSVLLVDTYDTLDGVRRAAEVGQAMAERGEALMGIRLDSGDLGQLARGARRILDDAGLTETAIVASNDLDEHAVVELVASGAPVDVFGVGTKLATAYDQPALGGVYKLAALRGEDGAWERRLKLSNTPIKVSDPGVLNVWRFEDAENGGVDVLVDELAPPRDGEPVLVVGADGQPRKLGPPEQATVLLQPVMREGKRVEAAEPLDTIRARAMANVAALPEAQARLDGALARPLWVEAGLHETKAALVARLRASHAAGADSDESADGGKSDDERASEAPDGATALVPDATRAGDA